MSELKQRLAAHIESIALVDTHEHINPENERLQTPQDLFSWFPHYASSDLVSAGMSYPSLERVRNTSLPLAERWREFEPHWQSMRNTAYARALLIAARDLHGIDDINTATCEDLSQRITAAAQPGFYRQVLRERAGIAVSINDTDYISPSSADLSLFAPTRRMDDFIAIRTRAELRVIERKHDLAIHSLADLVKALRLSLERAVADGYVAVKSALAYRRTLNYSKPTHHEAELVFNRMPNYLDEHREHLYPGVGLSFEECKPLQDYLMHQVIRAAIDLNLPLQIHTGLQEGTGNMIAHSRPALLAPLLFEYPQARFDLFHAGYPYTSEFTSLGKNFPNVYVDLCWVPVISPTVAKRVLHEWLETVPANKILAFGGDYRFVEGAYAHSRMARQVVTEVMLEKVESGYFSEEQALELSSWILRENGWRLFALEQRKTA